MPIIGALLTLRDKNIKSTMNSLALVDPRLLDIIKRLSHFYAPDLEENILEHAENNPITLGLNENTDDILAEKLEEKK